jgi:small acid-soluble spore protein F (minor alpha/beta-type SASP)
MSDDLKYEIAKELGIYDKVMSQGWGAVSSKECGMVVAKAIEKAQNSNSGQ